MKLLLDECVSRLVKPDFIGHEVLTVDDVGFEGLRNGDLLRAAADTFDVLITVDRKLARDQDISKSNIAVLVLLGKSNRYEHLALRFHPR